MKPSPYARKIALHGIWKRKREPRGTVAGELAMKVFITGGTGFVGSSLTKKLTEQGHNVTLLTRRIREDQPVLNGVLMLEGDPAKEGVWQEKVSEHDVLINLAGSSIFSRWKKEEKKIIRESRIRTTENLVNALKERKGRKTTLLSTSAVGYYGFRGDEELDESTPPGDDFLASVSKEWEETALKAEEFGARVLLCRFGIVLGKSGGALGQMLPIFRKGLGARLGSGEQWFSWIHQQDLIRIYLFLMDREDLSGPFNCTAPEPVKNRDLTRILAEVLGRPAFLPPVPGFVIKWIKGEFGSVLLQGQKVFPGKLLKAGFQFEFPGLKMTLTDLVG